MTKPAILAAAGAIIVIGAIILLEINRNKREEALVARIETLEQTIDELRTLITSLRKSTTANSDSRVASLQEKLISERTRREKAEAESRAMRDWASTFDDEVVITYGKVQEIGNDFGTFFREALALSEAEKNGELDRPENQKLAVVFLSKASSLGGLSRELIAFDGDPDTGAKFFASAYKSVFDLKEQKASELEGMFRDQISAAKALELTLNHLSILDGYRDDLPVEEQKAAARDWLRRRQEFYRSFRAQLREQIPADRREQFDAWVETDGIGFKNITFRGKTIGFTFGGKQSAHSPSPSR